VLSTPIPKDTQKSFNASLLLLLATLWNFLLFMSFVFMSAYCMFDLSVYYLFLQYFDTVGWVF